MYGYGSFRLSRRTGQGLGWLWLTVAEKEKKDGRKLEPTTAARFLYCPEEDQSDREDQDSCIIGGAVADEVSTRCFYLITSIY